ncbi:DUF6600 domain-containing protein [Spirosoma sp.]|uniref:DUF6600 domain-containing protein n=1 Tax=Spirosoma sp. TaxID=1899569 RepID=UPI003B3AB02F
MITLQLIKRVALIALLAFGFANTMKVAAQPGATVPVESFYDELAPYGEWMQYPSYGNVWRPNTGPDFQPYGTGGHWVVTEYGNTWISDYAWGWGPFHYGRWIYDPAYGGWLWVPGTDWGPAWVTWRSGGGYYGWAPLGPGWDINININIPAPYWTFVPQIYITSPNLYSYCVPRPNVVNIYRNTTIINNYYRTDNRAYAYGPPRGDIERITRRSVPVYRVDQLDRPGRSVVGNGSVGFYRPGADYRRNYSRDERFDNSVRPNYGGTNYPDRSNYENSGRNNNSGSAPNRDYNNGNATPGRVYNGRANRGNEYPDRNGGFNNPLPPNTGNSTMPSPGRGSYSPDNVPQLENRPMRGYTQRNAPQDGFSQQPNRSFERQPQVSSPSSPGGRSGADFQRMPENRSAQSQQYSQGQQAGGGPGRQARGPR